MDKNKEFINKYNGKDKEKLKSFFNKLDNKITLNKKNKLKVINDFENYIDYYSNSLTINEIIKRLDLTNFERGYTKNNDWYPLDNSSKIYPLSMKEDWMSIYRLSYYLAENVVHEVLQLALTMVISRFPIFRTSIRKGFFWNYLDGVNKHYAIEKENKIPCSKMNISKMGTQAFRVCYYNNRVSCEFFHVLSDAHGGIVFLTTLINEYYRLLGKKVNYNSYALDIKSNIEIDEIKDAFLDSVKEKNGSLIEEKALSIDGKLSVIKPCQILHFNLDYHKLHSFAKKKDVTINELLLAFLFLVISYSTSKNGSIKIQVPINLRKYHHSNTLRNYSLYTTISLEKKEIDNFENVLLKVKKQSREKITNEMIDGLAGHACQLVKSLSFIPLFIKHPIANFIYNHFGDKSSTTVLSNLGKIDIPQELAKEIIKADFVLGTNRTNRILFSVITVNNIVNLSISKFTTNKSLENNLYNLLREHDLIINVEGSDEYGN